MWMPVRCIRNRDRRRAALLHLDSDLRRIGGFGTRTIDVSGAGTESACAWGSPNHSYVIVSPLLTLAAMAILLHSGGFDLAGWSVIASFRVTTGQMGLSVTSEIIAVERS